MEQVLRERSFVRLLDDRGQEEHFSQPWQSSLLLLGFVRLSAGSLSPPRLPALEGKVPACVGGLPFRWAWGRLTASAVEVSAGGPAASGFWGLL